MIGSKKRFGSGALSGPVETLGCPPLLRCAVLLGSVVLWGAIATAQEAGVDGREPPRRVAESSPRGDGSPEAHSQSVAESNPLRSSEKTWYVSSLLRNQEDSYIVFHLWSKGARFRSETVITGHRVTTIVNGETYYVLDPVLGTGAGIERSGRAVAQDATRGRPFGNELDQILSQGGEKVRVDRAKGQECEIYRVTDEGGRRQVCVSMQEPRVPLRYENFDRKSGRTTYVTYGNWLVGLVISDAFFEPDQRIEMERVGYQEYRERVARGQTTGPAPVLYSDLLHGDTD